MDAKDALAAYRSTSPHDVCSQIESFKLLSQSEQLELLFYMSAHMGQVIYAMAAEDGSIVKLDAADKPQPN